MEDNQRDKHGFQVHKEVQYLFNQFSPIWEREEVERTRRWEHFLDATFCGQCDERVTPQQRKTAQLQGFSAWMSEYRNVPSILSEEKRTQVKMLVQAGVPTHLRGELWKILLDTKRSCVPGYYKAQTWSSQIDKDLNRTFTSHPSMDKDGCAALCRVLNAYAVHNPAVGYCQGMNFLAGLLLLFMPEEDAFWGLATIVEQLLGGYFTEDMVEAQVDQRTFKHLCDHQFPGLSRHLASFQVDISFVCSHWFLTAFVNVLPLEAVLRVWDSLLFELESSVLFRVAAAIVDQNIRNLMGQTDSVEIWTRLQRMPTTCFDSSSLVDSALLQYCHITREMLDKTRAVYRPGVQSMINERAESSTSTQSAAALSRKISIEGMMVDRRISVELDVSLPLEAAFFPSLEYKAAQAALAMATPEQHDGGNSAATASNTPPEAASETEEASHSATKHKGNAPSPFPVNPDDFAAQAVHALLCPYDDQHAAPKAAQLRYLASLASPTQQVAAAALESSRTCAVGTSTNECERCDEDAHDSATPRVVAGSPPRSRVMSASPPSRAANATQLVVATYAAAHTIMEAGGRSGDESDQRISSSLKVLHMLEREVINQQQQAAETRRQAEKVRAAVRVTDVKQHDAVEQLQVAATAEAIHNQCAQDLRERVSAAQTVLREKGIELEAAEQLLQVEHEKMKHLDTVIDDLLLAQKKWYQATPRPSKEPLPVTSSSSKPPVSISTVSRMWMGGFFGKKASSLQ